MIHQTNFSGGHLGSLELDRTPTAALSCLVNEISIGGYIRGMTDPHVMVETEVVEWIGVTHFEGSETEMLPLTRVAVAFRTALTIGRDHAIEGACQQLGGIPNGENMFLVANFFPMLVGQRIATLTMACAFSGLGIEDEALLRRITALSHADQCAVFVLAHENPDVPVSELVQLAAPVTTKPTEAASAA